MQRPIGASPKGGGANTMQKDTEVHPHANRRFNRLLTAMSVGEEKPEPMPDKAETKKQTKEKPAN